MVVQVFTALLFFSAALLVESKQSEASESFAGSFSEIYHEERELPSVRNTMEKFKFDVLPQLKLTEKTGKDGIDDLNKLEFQCTIVPERKDFAYPSKIRDPFIECTKPLLANGQVYGLLFVFLRIKGWHGDGTSLTTRFEQLPRSAVVSAAVMAIPYTLDHSGEHLGEVSRQLDQKFSMAKNGQSLFDVASYAMANDISCMVTSSPTNTQSTLECSARKLIPQCRYAVISMELSRSSAGSGALSLLSTDARVSGKQSSWICLK